jgi:hypothetical protein
MIAFVHLREGLEEDIELLAIPAGTGRFTIPRMNEHVSGMASTLFRLHRSMGQGQAFPRGSALLHCSFYVAR